MALRSLRGDDVPESARGALASDRVAAVVADTRHILAANDRYLDLVGYDRDEVADEGLSWLRLTPPEWLASDARAIGELNATGRGGPYEKEYVRRDGSRLRVRLALLPPTDPSPDGDLIFALIARADDEDAAGALDAVA